MNIEKYDTMKADKTNASDNVHNNPVVVGKNGNSPKIACGFVQGVPIFDAKEPPSKERFDMNELQLLSIPEACKRLGIGHWNIYQLINKKAIKTVKLGKRRLVSVRALNEFVESLEQ